MNYVSPGLAASQFSSEARRMSYQELDLDLATAVLSPFLPDVSKYPVWKVTYYYCAHMPITPFAL